MSFGDGQSRLFLEPLAGKTAAFRLADRPSNIKFAIAILKLFGASRRGCRVLDLDAFYSSNLQTLVTSPSQESLSSTELTIPEPGSDVDGVLSDLFLTGYDKPLLIDSVNTLYQLISSRNPRAATRKFTFFVSALSSWARSNGGPALASIYDRRPEYYRKPSRSLADAFDVSVSVSTKDYGLAFKCERGTAWRGGTFFLASDGR
jgi:hypothetical protein